MGTRIMTKRFILLGLSLMILTAAAPLAQALGRAEHPRNMTFAPIAFSPSMGERIVLDNGMILYVLEDHEIPSFNISAVIRTGSIYDPPAKAGLARLTGKVMRTGGTRSMTSEEINDQLEYIAGSMETAITRESGSASLSVMAKDINTGLKMFGDVLMNPVFDPKYVDLAKKQEVEIIRRRNDSPDDIAIREFRQRLYKNNPRAWISGIRSINAITRLDLLEFHNRFFRLRPSRHDTR